MIVEKQQTEYEQSDASAQSFSFGIDEEDICHITTLLENKVYRDKILAVVREYACNSADAHVEVGCPDRPIFIQLPTDFEPNFKVRDYGRGLSEERLKTVFTRYGKSTKRNTNSQTGCLGIGCKAGFAYANSFMVISRHNGQKYTYNATKDDKGYNRLIELIKEETTEEPGLEIIIPVADSDFVTFRRKALELFRWFRVKPQIEGLSEEEQSKLVPQRKILAQGNDWTIYDSGHSRAIMGNIGYELSPESLSSSYFKVQKLFQDLPVEMEFNIGELDIVISREGLEYTEKTSKKLVERAAEILNKLQGVVQEQFDACPTMWEAKNLYGCLFCELSEKNTYYRQFREFVGRTFTWQGHPVDSDKFTIPEKINLYRLFRGKRDKVKFSMVENVRAYSKTLFIIDDVASLRSAKNRLTPLLDNPDYSNILLISAPEDVRAKWLKDNCLENLTLRKVSEFPPVRKARGTSAANNKHVARTFILNDCAGDKPSDYWDTEEEIDFSQPGIYVELERFQARINGHERTGGELQDYLEQLGRQGICIDELYGFKASFIEKNQSLLANWVSLEKHARAEIQAIAPQVQQELVDYDAKVNHATDEKAKAYLPFLTRNASGIQKKNGVAAQYIDAYLMMSETVKKIESLKKLIEVFGCEKSAGVQPTFDLGNLAAQFHAKYPMLQFIDNYYFKAAYYKEINDTALNYINEIDKL